MSNVPPTPSNPPPTHFPDWAAVLIAPADQGAAIAAFLSMARADSNSTDMNPRIRVQNPFEGKGTLWMSFNLMDPAPAMNKEGNQDHTLFKGPNDTEGRARQGRRDPSEYMADRAARIPFIAKTLRHPNVRVFRVIAKPSKLVFTCRVGPDEHFLVYVKELPSENPKFAYVTAYYITDANCTRRMDEDWERVYPKAYKPQDKRKSMKKRR